MDNESLIAVSNELLETLQGVMEWMKQYHPLAYENSPKARALIAKATEIIKAKGD